MSKAEKKGFIPSYVTYLNNLKEFYNLVTHSYQVVPAVNAEIKAEAFKLRHKVYCSELNYEETNSQEQEQDEFDHHSTQMLVYSRAHKSYIGCVRLVHGRHEGEMKDLPFEHHCKGRINHKILNMVKESGQKYAEVSRLAVEKDFRHCGRSKTKRAMGGQPKSSFALLSLYLGIHAMARQQNVRYLFAIVEPRLLKNMHRHNIPAIQIGEGVDHRGLRVPILIDVEDIEKIITAAVRPVYNAIRRDVAKFVRPCEEKEIPYFNPLSLREMMVENKIISFS
jgi:N-acyl amino acid synthase of PEP-CTERM/exosortase system